MMDIILPLLISAVIIGLVLPERSQVSKKKKKIEKLLKD